MKARQFTHILVASAAALLFAPTAQAANADYEQAVEATKDYRYSVALMHFKRAAEQGDAEAQRNLGLMLLYGSQLFGSDVASNRSEGRRWLKAAASQGCDVSRFMLKMGGESTH